MAELVRRGALDAPRPARELETLLLDFGVAKLMAHNAQVATLLTKTGMRWVPFTPNYGAPEQYSRTFGATGPWTDVFSLALVTAEMLCGRSPLGGDDLAQLAFASTDRQHRPTPRALGVALSDALEAVFARALAVEPHERYASAGEFWAALQGAAAPRARTSSASTLVSSSWARLSTTKEPRRGGLPQALIGGVAALGMLAASGALFREHLKSEERAVASRSAAALLAEPTPALPPAPAPIAEAPACPVQMALIPAGQFFQGSDGSAALPNERPPHAVELGSYCIDLYEATSADYSACSDVGRCKRASDEVNWPGISEHERDVYSALCNRGASDKQDHPINCVSWEMADLYCQTQDKRLPTEAEWEYAARGPDGRTYPWGDDEPTPKHLNACGSECAAWGQDNRLTLTPLYAADDGYSTTAPVGSFPAGRSRFGLYDVTGNVWEWVADWYADYSAKALPAKPEKDPIGPASGERRVIRGGAWNGSYASWLRPSFRYAQDPGALSHGIGFRCALSLAPRPAEQDRTE